MIELEKVSVLYGKKDTKINALKDIDLSIDKGEFVTISGKSGCGKTTLLNILGGIIKPNSGHYYYNGEDVSKFNDNKLAGFRNKSVSFIVQHFALINDITVYDNIILPLKYRKGGTANAKKVIEETMEKLGILSKKNKYPFQISGGEKQRVAICRAIVSDANVILADEPTGALDEETGRKILNILKDLNNSGKTIIMVTHDPELAKEGTKRIILRDGMICSII